MCKKNKQRNKKQKTKKNNGKLKGKRNQITFSFFLESDKQK